MLKVGQLIKHLSATSPEKSELTLSLLNFLDAFCLEDDLVSEETLDKFFGICLDYAHWQQNRKHFQEVLHPLLDGLMDISTVRWPHQIQYLEIENIQDLTDLLERYLNSLHKKGEKYRLILDNDKRVFAIVLNPDRSITVRIFDRKVMVRQGQLEPLKKHQCLYYNNQLELETGVRQCLDLSPYVTAQFYLLDGQLRCSVSKNYLLQKVHDLTGLELSNFPKLFFSLKRIEQFFIHRDSNPFYKQTTEAVEQAIEKARLEGVNDPQEYLDILGRAYNILEYVFKGDKLLTLLIRDLQHTVSSRESSVATTPRKEVEPWNHLALKKRPRSSSDLIN